ncbi:adenosylmethionine decarboxylase [Neolewinella antarctica]|uniref:S-adenosylmethionine decarboxylase proenzyme n=1 Tax=Neolewinella antarctica TaxID=442734 RepID=A0ABX0X8Z1_9BACT|nr:adenosylmethionine decarboxylase [Neolewinella antarctica]NJC25720.1 S-adenosylmethionine decarboxylase proenzyme [Neolewinella antarctica]
MSETPAPPTALGRHVLLELYDCDADLLKFPPDSERILLGAAAAMGATVMGSHFHAFPTHGVSGVVIIAESHLTVHTWPEHGYAAVDVFSCGVLDLEAGISYLTKAYGAKRTDQKVVERGLLTPSLKTRDHSASST